MVLSALSTILMSIKQTVKNSGKLISNTRTKVAKLRKKERNIKTKIHFPLPE